MFLKVFGGFCLGLGLALSVGLIVVIPATKAAFDTVADPAGWYGPLEGIARGTGTFVFGALATLAVGFVMGLVGALLAARFPSPWFLAGYVVLAAPLLFLVVSVASSRASSTAEKGRLARQREEMSKASSEAMAESAARHQAEARAKAVAVFDEPVNGPSELLPMERYMGDLYYPGAFLAPPYATRTDPPSVWWPVVTLKCPGSASLEAVTAYYAALGVVGAESASGAAVVRPGDKVHGRLTLRAPQPDAPDQRITVTFTAEGF